jgi:hypothetical protein
MNVFLHGGPCGKLGYEARKKSFENMGLGKWRVTHSCDPIEGTAYETEDPGTGYPK